MNARFVFFFKSTRQTNSSRWSLNYSSEFDLICEGLMEALIWCSEMMRSSWRSCYNTEGLLSKQPRAAELRGAQLTRDAPESQTTPTPHSWGRTDPRQPYNNTRTGLTLWRQTDRQAVILTQSFLNNCCLPTFSQRGFEVCVFRQAQFKMRLSNEPFLFSVTAFDSILIHVTV